MAGDQLHWRQTDAATLQDVRIAAKLAEVIKDLGSMGTLEYRYAGYRRIVVDRSGEGILTRVETREPIIPEPSMAFVDDSEEVA